MSTRRATVSKIFEAACKPGLGGIVSKRRDMRYVAGKSKARLKIKNPNSPAMLRLDDEEWSWNKRGAKWSRHAYRRNAIE